jgi:UDP-N-acetylbacillosamine N-acetyltransferase
MIVGAGGHARVVASILALDPDILIVGVADRTEEHFGERVGSSQVLATFEQTDVWERLGAAAAAIAIGDNKERAAMFDRLTAAGWPIAQAIHPTAIIEASAVLGQGCVACAGSIVGAEAVLGDNVLINTAATVDHESRVGAHAHIGPGVVLAGRTCIGELSFIGAGSTIRDGVIVGARTVVGCGSVVVDNLPDGVIAFGVPARVRRLVE